MNKARKKTYKKGISKRLVNESFILSSTRFVSSRVVRIFETGFASPLLTSFKKVDNFVRKKVTKPLFEKLKLRKNFSMPVRNALAGAVARNSLMQKLSMLRNAFLNSSLRSVGMFMLIFGGYTACMFLLKRYIASSLGVANVNDIALAAVLMIVGLLLTAFGDKSILSSVGGGLIGSALFSDCLGVNDSAFERNASKPTRLSVFAGFLLGTLFGMLTLLVSPFKILLGIAGFLVAVTVLNIPEFGLLSAIAISSFVHVKYVAAMAFLTVVSYFLKCLRLKRNFKFGTADVIMLVVFIVSVSVMSGSGFTDGERFFICAMLLYFVAKNVISSEKLLCQSFNAVSLSLFMGIALDLIGDYAHYIPFADIRYAAQYLSEYALHGEMLAMLAIVVFPYVLFSFSSYNTKRNKFFLLLMIFVLAFLYNSMLLYVLILSSLFVFNMFTKKAPAESILGAAITMPPVLAVLSHYAKATIVTLNSPAKFDMPFGISGELRFVDFWSAFSKVAGDFAPILLTIGILLILQRVLGCMATIKSSKMIYICGTVVSSAVMLVVCNGFFNSFSDLRLVVVCSFILGMCGSVSSVSLNSQFKDQEV